MTLAIAITAAAVFLCGASIGILAVLVVGIRSDDRTQNLTRAPRTGAEVITRRVLGAGTRNHGSCRCPAVSDSPEGDLS